MAVKTVADLPLKASPAGTELVELQDGVGAGASKHTTAQAVADLKVVTLTGDVTGSGAGSVATTIADDAVTYAKIQNVATARLLGRATSGSGNTEEITLGTNLSFTGTTLNAAGSAAGLTWSAQATGITMAATNGYIVTGAVTMTLPASLTVGNEILVHASGVTVQVAVNGHTIEGAGGTVTGTDTLEVVSGETAHMVARTTAIMRIV